MLVKQHLLKWTCLNNVSTSYLISSSTLSCTYIIILFLLNQPPLKPSCSCRLVILLLSLRALSSGQCVLKRSDIQLLSPVLAPEKVVCVGMNYRDHCLEQNAPIPKEPIIFSKFPCAITGPYDDIILPAESQVRAGKKRGKDRYERGGCFLKGIRFIWDMFKFPLNLHSVNNIWNMLKHLSAPPFPFVHCVV